LKGTLYIVGIGPGKKKYMTLRAIEAIKKSSVVVGYELYLQLIKGMLKGKEIISTQMTEEIDRARAAIEKASEGHTVSLVSSGDPGVYGIAGLAFEIISQISQKGQKLDFTVEVVPGVTAANAASALLGAPLMHDYAVISLSDMLTPWDVIERRIKSAAEADFIIVIYNPKGSRFRENLGRAREIILQYRRRSTPVGIVRKAYRKGQKVIITDLENMLKYKVDMVTTIIIGNSTTFTFENYMVTPRGYSKKYELLPVSSV